MYQSIGTAQTFKVFLAKASESQQNTIYFSHIDVSDIAPYVNERLDTVLWKDGHSPVDIT